MLKLNKTIVFLVIYAALATAVFSQMPTPTPTQIPNIPNSTYFYFVRLNSQSANDVRLSLLVPEFDSLR